MTRKTYTISDIIGSYSNRPNYLAACLDIYQKRNYAKAPMPLKGIKTELRYYCLISLDKYSEKSFDHMATNKIKQSFFEITVAKIKNLILQN